MIFLDIKQINKYRNLGMNVSFYRRAQGLTQQQLAEMLGVDKSHIGHLEQATAGVSLDVIFRLSDVLNVPVNKFFELKY